MIGNYFRAINVKYVSCHIPDATICNKIYVFDLQLSIYFRYTQSHYNFILNTLGNIVHIASHYE